VVGSSDQLGGTVTFVFTDIEGSTRLLKQLGREQYGGLLAQQQALVRDVVAANAGEEIDTQGDSFFLAFRSASSAVSAAVAIQRALADHQWPSGSEVRVRVGIHSGEAAASGERYVGFSVHRAARIGAVAHGGQVLLSSSTRELVADDLPAGVGLRDLGLYRLKDVDRPERMWQVVADGLPKAFPPLRGAARLRAPVLRSRSVLAAALVGVVAAAVAVPVFALSSNGSGNSKSLANLAGNSVGVVDLDSGRVTASVPLNSAPNAVASGAGSIWIAISSRNLVERINPTTNQPQQTVVTPGGPAAIAVGGGFVWVAEALAGTVVQIDPSANGGQRVATIPVGNGPTGIAYGSGGVWVANSVDNTVVRIDPRTDATSAPIGVDAGADAVAAGDGAVWVTSQSTGVLSKIDPVARSVSQTTNVGNQPVAVATGPGAVWVANSEDGTVDRVDPKTATVDGTITVGKEPNGIAVEPDGTVWVSNALSGTLSEIEPSSTNSTNGRTVVVGATPQGIAFSGAAGYVPVQESTSAHRGGTLTVAIANQAGFYTNPLPGAFDPASGYGTWELTTMTNDGLLGYSRAGGTDTTKVVPDLAAALPTVSDAGRTYTFQLRSGVHYSTGGLVQPADIRRGIERALLESHGQPPSSYLSGIVGAKSCLTSKTHCDLSHGIETSPGSNTITFHLLNADPDFLYQLALPPFDAVPASTPLKAPLPLPATGPYKIVSYQKKPKVVVQLARNPQFHVWSAAAQPAGYPNKIVERYDYTGASAVRAVEHGQANITTDGPDQTWPLAVTRSLETRQSSQLYAAPQPAVLGLWLNTRLPPFNNLQARQALNYAVDRNHIVQLNGGPISSEVTCQILTPDTNGYKRYCPYTVRPDATGTYHGPNLAKAKKLVASSGTKGDQVTIWFYDIPIGHRNGGYFVSVLRQLGYSASLKTIPHTGPVWRPSRQAGIDGWGSDYPSANNVFSPTFTCNSYSRNPATNYNTAAFCKPALDAEMRRAATLQATNPSAAAALWTSIDRKVTDQAPWVAMKESLSTDFVSRQTGNYKYCWLAATTGLVGACLDQLWVR
jgi:YVTN family beta-propeller protein